MIIQVERKDYKTSVVDWQPGDEAGIKSVTFIASGPYAHGYLKGEQERCGRCHSETEVYSRVVGYLRPVKQWNNGKQAEYRMRKTFKVA